MNMLVPLWAFSLEMYATGTADVVTAGGSVSMIETPRWESRWREPVGGIRWIMAPLLSLF